MDELDDAFASARSPESVSASMTTRCRDTLAERADLRFYTTTEAVADLDFVRRGWAPRRSTWWASPTAPASLSSTPRPPEHVRT
jgi:hypothetical protein